MKNFILILCLATFSQWVYAQNKQITGRVVDTKGEAAIGASILEKGTTNGTITDFDGNFKLTVGPKAVLQISYIGYKTQEIPVANKTKLNITMEEDTEVLDEVVVVGYGAQKKESVVGAISQVSSKELLKSPAANISQAIAGKISGVITSQTSGAPGSDDMKIYIRGRASFAGDNQPLILVDGVEREFSQIAPDDIESISTLKDASATAVYGVRGANGVMLITTKRGKEQKPTVSLTANWQIQSPTRQNTYLQLLQDPQYEELWAELLGGFAQGGGELMTPDSTRTPTGTLQWPLPVAGTITSQFGHRVDPITGEVSSHTGTDIACAEGTPILAAADGVITVANGLDSWGGSYGYYIQIDHGGGLETLYAHCSSICVTTGQQVQSGQVIGYVGHTGRATGSHLHFEIHINKIRKDAMSYFGM